MEGRMNKDGSKKVKTIQQQKKSRKRKDKKNKEKQLRKKD